MAGNADDLENSQTLGPSGFSSSQGSSARLKTAGEGAMKRESKPPQNQNEAYLHATGQYPGRKEPTTSLQSTPLNAGTTVKPTASDSHAGATVSTPAINASQVPQNTNKTYFREGATPLTNAHSSSSPQKQESDLTKQVNTIMASMHSQQEFLKQQHQQQQMLIHQAMMMNQRPPNYPSNMISQNPWQQVPPFNPGMINPFAPIQLATIQQQQQKEEQILLQQQQQQHQQQYQLQMLLMAQNAATVQGAMNTNINPNPPMIPNYGQPGLLPLQQGNSMHTNIIQPQAVSQQPPLVNSSGVNPIHYQQNIHANSSNGNMVVPNTTDLFYRDLEEQGRTSYYRLKIVKDEVRTPFYSLAWDIPLLVLSKSGMGKIRQWNFSLRCRKEVYLKEITLDQMERTEFKLSQISAHHRTDVVAVDALLHEGCLNWKDTNGKKVTFAVVQVEYNPPANSGKEQKVEVCIQFHLSNETVFEKYIQVVKVPEGFAGQSYERESIETYSAPHMGVKKRRVVTSDYRMDNWTKNLEDRYKLRPDCSELGPPDVREMRKESYKGDMHRALFLEEMAQTSALDDISFQANVDFVTAYPNGDNKYIKANKKTLFAICKCPFTVTENSIRGEALNDVAAYVILSRRGDWDRSDVSINCISGKIVNRFFRAETETYSIYDLRREVRNYYLVAQLNKEEITSLRYEEGRSEYMYVELLLNRKLFLHCHYSIDQIADVSPLVPDAFELSYSQKPPWYVPTLDLLEEHEQIALINQNKVNIMQCEQDWRRQYKCKNASCLRRTPAEHQKVQNYQNQFRERYFLSDLNYKQQEACEACWFNDTTKSKSYPPILISGPFGTGKTYTIAHATTKIVKDFYSCRILICIVSRNTGNAYHRQLVESNLGDKCIRLFSEDDDLSSVDRDLLKYSNCSGGTLPKFRDPRREEIENKNVVIVTLSATMLLHKLNFDVDHFSHVFIDEAAQVAEFFLVPVLAFASTRNKLCMTGDVMQLNPFLFSRALSDSFCHSIVQRFSQMVYNKRCGFRFDLDVNYRSHVEILKFAYGHFYHMMYNDQSETKSEQSIPGNANYLKAIKRSLV